VKSFEILLVHTLPRPPPYEYGEEIIFSLRCDISSFWVLISMKKDHFYSNLEDRLIAFSVKIIDLAYRLQAKSELKSITQQILRSGISPALNYGEAMHAESKKDFIHKMKIALKELRETHISLKILYSLGRVPFKNEIIDLKEENNELLAIFVSSVKTAQQNMIKGKKE
jgi:four helix bundle protein